MNISLTPDLEQFIAEEVATGRYPTEGEVVRDALRNLRTGGNPAEAYAALHQEIGVRMAEAKAGDFVDVDEMWAELEHAAPAR